MARDPYREIVERSADGIWVLALTGETLYANPAMARMLGRAPAELAGLDVADVLDERGRRDFEAHVAELHDGATRDGDVEVLLHRADGTPFWTLASETLLAADPDDPDGSPARIVARFTHFDERRASLERETDLREILAEAEGLTGMGSVHSDVASDHAVASEGLLRMLDLPRDRPLRRQDVFDLIHPDDAHVLAAYREWDPDDGPYAYEARYRTPTGYRWFAGRVARRMTGRGEGRVGSFIDIHDRRQAESALEDAVLQNVLLQAAAAAANEARTFHEGLRLAQQLILATGDWQRARAYAPDPDGGPPVPLYVNDDDRAADLADPSILPAERSIAARCIAEARLLWEEESFRGGPMVAFPVQVPGEVVAVGVISSETPIERPDMIRSVLAQAGSQMARVAERDRGARELAAARDAAMEASRQKSDFLATMSHEIRTPLNGVIGLNDLLLRTDLDADQQRLVTGIQVSSRSLLGIINDILDFSKIEAGHLVLETMDFDVRGVLDQVASVIGESARAKGLELVVSCDPEVPAVLSGDPTRLAQVLTNLGSNAVKFTEAGSVTLRLRLADGPRGGGGGEPGGGSGGESGGAAELVLAAEVTDTGIGITPEQQELVFHPFAQADASTTRRFGGSGLGLAICREIVEALRGDIGVRSTPGRGSTFWFTVRMGEATGDGVGAEDVAAREELVGRRVLVVDDNEHNRLILSEQVGWWGVRCTTVTSVAEAVAALEEADASGDSYDLVLLDLQMPERDGFGLADEVRARASLQGLPLVMLSSTLPPDPERLRRAGIAGSVTKPVLASTLRALLMRYLAPEAAGAVAAAALPRTAAADVPAGQRPRVLVVEDNQVNQMVASGLLDALGYDAEVVDDGDGAVEAVASHEPDHWGAVLMDLQMPRVDGFEATLAIRELEKSSGRVDPGRGRVPIVAMTASAIAGERERCLEAGMDDFLTKPVDPRTLAVTMDRWVPRHGGDPLLVADAAGVRRGEAAAAAPAGGPVVDASGAVVLDRDRLDMLREVDDEGAYLARVLDRFEANHVSQVAAVAEAVSAADPVALRSTAHSLKGTLTNLGLVSAGRLAFELEQLGTDGRATPGAERLPALREAVAAGLEALRGYRDDHAMTA